MTPAITVQELRKSYRFPRRRRGAPCANYARPNASATAAAIWATL